MLFLKMLSEPGFIGLRGFLVFYAHCPSPRVIARYEAISMLYKSRKRILVHQS